MSYNEMEFTCLSCYSAQTSKKCCLQLCGQGPALFRIKEGENMGVAKLVSGYFNKFGSEYTQEVADTRNQL